MIMLIPPLVVDAGPAYDRVGEDECERREPLAASPRRHEFEARLH
jgi:hypothetical protein